jgi:HAD superfamily 5'-nucleotidase-like hydrolase
VAACAAHGRSPPPAAPPPVAPLPVAPPPAALSADAISLPPLPRRVFCNRTLNLRSIQVVGCDMDYTLVHYDSERWEQSAYEHMRRAFEARGWPVHQLRFEPELASLGLVIDVERGNLVKANRFGHVRNACHGTAMLDFVAWREVYGTAPIDLAESRWQFMNTLFSLSEACLYMQLVDLLDLGRLEPGLSYSALYVEVRRVLDATHLEGELKAEILSDPSRYVILDEELPKALWELKAAGKQLLLITNSEWSYTQSMMSYAFDRFLPHGSWRELFTIVIVQARKPEFFSRRAPVFRLVDEPSRYTPHIGPLKAGDVYLGGDARSVEASLGVEPDHILYIGDHIFADVHVSKDLLRWRTALIVRELERELEALAAFRSGQAQLDVAMTEKVLLEHQLSGAAAGAAAQPAPAAAGFRQRASQRGDPRLARPPGRARSAYRAARAAVERAHERTLGPHHAGRQRQEPSGPPDRALRRRVHVASIQSAGVHALRVSARAARRLAPRDRPG